MDIKEQTSGSKGGADAERARGIIIQSKETSQQDVNADEEDGEGDGESEEKECLAKMLAYMESCLPAAEEAARSSVGSWLAEQAAPTPTLLPSLRFHDLVFGRELGRGAFR